MIEASIIKSAGVASHSSATATAAAAAVIHTLILFTIHSEKDFKK